MRRSIAALLSICIAPAVGAAQKSPADGAVAQAGAAAPPALYSRETPLAITLTTNIGQLRHDRGDKAPWRAATLTITDSAGKAVVLQARAKTHGMWRLKHCDLPPLRLDVSGNAAKKTELQGMGQPKIVNSCRDSDSYEQLLLSELQAYRAYQLVTPASHRVRLARTTWTDSASGKSPIARYMILMEDPDKMAERLGGKLLKEKGASATDLEPAQGAIALLFEYMISNLDFSFRALHNTELVGLPDGTYLPVVYDFDFSGVVDAPYATVDPQFGVKSVRQRVFRGFCAHRVEYPAAAALFLSKKDSIYALYGDGIGKLMDARRVRETLRFYDEFFETISSPRRAERLFDSCVGAR
jgi:hypothetical protein